MSFLPDSLGGFFQGQKCGTWRDLSSNMFLLWVQSMGRTCLVRVSDKVSVSLSYWEQQ